MAHIPKIYIYIYISTSSHDRPCLIHFPHKEILLDTHAFIVVILWVVVRFQFYPNATLMLRALAVTLSVACERKHEDFMFKRGCDKLLLDFSFKTSR